MFTGVVPEPPGQVEEAQEDDERVPNPGGAAALYRALPVRGHERVALLLRRRRRRRRLPLAGDGAAARRRSLVPRPVPSPARPAPRPVPHDPRRRRRRRGRHWGRRRRRFRLQQRRDGPRPAARRRCRSPVALLGSLRVMWRRLADDVADDVTHVDGVANGVVDDVTDGVRHAGHWRCLARHQYCVTAAQGSGTYRVDFRRSRFPIECITQPNIKLLLSYCYGKHEKLVFRLYENLF